MKISRKRILSTLLIAISGILLFATVLAYPRAPEDRPITWGVTFSQKFADSFDGVRWQEAYRAILMDLNIKDVRLVAYWDLIEKAPNEFYPAMLDWQLTEAMRNDASVILAVGRKMPRWPECHIPQWAQQLSSEEQNKELLEYVAFIVDRYKNHPAVRAFQIENEPFLSFGECPKLDVGVLEEEIAIAHTITEKPILLTDSGELSTWYRAAKRGDIFGTTMYRQIQNDIVGIQTYPIPAAFFRLKTRLVKMMPKASEKEFIVIELQGEPWMKKQPYETYPEQLEVLDIEKFKEYIDYAKRAGFSTYYLWGAEWWFWLQQTKDHPEFWNYVKTLNAQ